MLKIAITGHRSLSNEQNVQREIALSLEYFKTIDSNIVCYSALAEGADTLFADEAIKAGLPLQIYLPFELAEYEKDFSAAGLVKMRKLVSQSKNSCIIVSQKPITNREERNAAYLVTGKALVNSCDILLAVWDGRTASGTGGTAEIVSHAEIMHKEIHVIRAYRNEEQKEEVDRLYDKYDRLAVKLKRKFQVSWMVGLWSGVVAVACFGTTILFHEAFSETVVLFEFGEFGFVCLSGLLLAVTAHRKREKFLFYRRHAEYLRGMMWLRDADLTISDPAFESFVQANEVKACTKNLFLYRDVKTGFAHQKRMVWSLSFDQIRYHKHSRVKSFECRLQLTRILTKTVKYIFFAAATIKFLLEMGKHISKEIKIHQVIVWLEFVVLVLPTVYAAIEGWKYFSEWKQNISSSKMIIGRLEKIQQEVHTSDSFPALARLAEDVRNILETENIQWTIDYAAKELEAKP
jgi:hypothetical protein